MQSRSMAYRIASGLKDRVPEHPSSVEELQFSIEAIVNTVATIILALVISHFTGQTTDTIFAMLAFAILRSVSGGLHLKHSWTCSLATSVVANAVSFIGPLPLASMMIMAGVSIVLAFLFAPSRIDQQTRIPVKYFPVLKFISIVIVCSNFYFHSSIVAVSFLIQCVLLIQVPQRMKGGD